MVRNDLLKFLLLFVFVISLVSMVGCGDDDGGDFNGEPGIPETKWEISNEGPMTTVFVNFGFGQCITVEDWSTIPCTGMADTSCMKTNDLECNFTIDSGSKSNPTKCTLPLPPCGPSSFTFAIGGAPNCGTTPFNGPTAGEVNVYGDIACSKTPGCDTSPCDCADISVVNGFTVPISITMSDGPTTLGPVTSGGVTDNKENFGVFPVGCTTCVTRSKCPCPPPPGTGGSGLDCNSNDGCHPPAKGPFPDAGDPECQSSQPSGGTITLNIL